MPFTHETSRNVWQCMLYVVRDYAPTSIRSIRCFAWRACAETTARHRPSRKFSPRERRISVVGETNGLRPSQRCFIHQHHCGGAWIWWAAADLMAGDLSLIVGTPETCLYECRGLLGIRPMVFQRSDAALPAWINEVDEGKPLVLGYRILRHAPVATPIDSIVVIRAAIETFANEAVNVVLTTGYQELPAEFGELPSNFRHAEYCTWPVMASAPIWLCFIWRSQLGDDDAEAGLRSW